MCTRVGLDKKPSLFMVWPNVTKQACCTAAERPVENTEALINILKNGFDTTLSGCKGMVEVKLSLCLTKEALRHEDVWGSGYIDPCFLDLGTSWRWVVSFTARSLDLRGNSPRYQLARRLRGPQSRSGRHWRSKNSCPSPGLELRPFGHPARSP
jgi:hypothetical protein